VNLYRMIQVKSFWLCNHNPSQRQALWNEYITPAPQRLPSQLGRWVMRRVPQRRGIHDGCNQSQVLTRYYTHRVTNQLQT
jgi:hypothetical protein